MHYKFFFFNVFTLHPCLLGKEAEGFIRHADQTEYAFILCHILFYARSKRLACSGAKTCAMHASLAHITRIKSSITLE